MQQDSMQNAQKSRAPELPGDDPDYSAYPAETVWNTVLCTLPARAIALLNTLSGSDFSPDQRPEYLITTSITTQPDGTEMAPREDVRFSLTDADGCRKCLHPICCPDWDQWMLGEFVYSDLRFAEWMAELTGKRESDPDRPGVVLLRAEMPRQFIINLRDTHRIPAEIEVVLGENQENCIILGIQVQNMPALRVEDLLQPGRLALLPFYIYTHAGDLQVLAEDPRQAELLIAEIADICTQLRQMSEEGTITPFEHSVLLELMRVVTRNAVPGTIVSEKAAEKVKAEMLTIALDPVGLFRWKDRDRFAAGKSAGRRHKRWDGPRRWIRSARTADPHR